MHFIADNLKFIRKKNGWTQDQLARQLGVKRSLIGAYEEGRADPRISFLMHLCQKFGYSMDQWVGKLLDEHTEPNDRYSGSNLRILPITVEKESNSERVTLVPVQAAAGYLNGLSDVEYIESLPMFDLPYPEVSKGKTYRVFQIKGESMLPIPSEAYILGSYVMDWNDIRNDEPCIVISRSEGIVFKRVLNNLKQGYLTLKSDNPDYDTYDIAGEEIAEVWKAEGFTVFGFEHPQQGVHQELMRELKTIRQRVEQISTTKKE
ncbi:MAG: helix-turn-helix domain-containing protein [Cryomorphaceae bacterium]